jgi:transcriptional regulator GlxA family with amidase domain
MTARLQVEILHDADTLHGPGMAVVDLLGTMQRIAALRDDPVRIGWQWTTADGRAAPRHLPASGRRLAWPQVLVVPGWAARNGPHLDTLVQRRAAACERLRAVRARGGALLGVYTGVALIGAAGLLDDREAAVPWPFAQSIRRQAPTMRLAAEDAWIGCDRIWTCDSPARTTEAMLALLRDGAHRALAESSGAVLLQGAERRRLSVQLEASNRMRIGPGALERARRWLVEHVDQPYRLETLARAAATSPRSLLRHFGATYGQSPLQYLHGLRITRARMLLETSYLTVEAIAEACGWRDTAMFRRVFRTATGTSPSAYRERFRLRGRRRDWGADLPAPQPDTGTARRPTHPIR